MNVDLALVAVSVALLPFSVVSTFLIVSAAYQRPRIGILTDRAIIALDITLMIISGVTVSINRITGYSLFPIEVARVLFLVSLILLELVPVYWLWLWKTGRLGPGRT